MAVSTRSLLALLSLVAVFAASLFTPAVSRACPFCSAPSLTLSEQVAQSDAAVLVQWASGEKPRSESEASEDSDQVSAPARSLGTTSYEIIEVLRGSGDDLKKGGQITIPRYRAG